MVFTSPVSGSSCRPRRARDGVLRRLTLWAQGLRRIYSQGQLSGKRNQMMQWVMDDRKEHCRSCFYLNGVAKILKN